MIAGVCHQPWPLTDPHMTSLIWKICLFARSGINKISIFKSIYLENHVSYNELWSNFCLKKWEELIYCGKSWNIGQVCFEYLMFMNFVALIYCVKMHWPTAFLFNEAVLKFAKLLILAHFSKITRSVNH
jgi:hypothetical protein